MKNIKNQQTETEFKLQLWMIVRRDSIGRIG